MQEQHLARHSSDFVSLDSLPEDIEASSHTKHPGCAVSSLTSRLTLESGQMSTDKHVANEI